MKLLHLTPGVVLLCAALLSPAAVVSLGAESARVAYTRALARERGLREAAKPALRELRGAIRAYEAVVSRHPASGYSDNALWQAANLAAVAYERYRQDPDRRTALRLLDHLKQHYPSSSLVARIAEVRARLETAPAVAVPATAPALATPAPAVSAAETRASASAVPAAADKPSHESRTSPEPRVTAGPTTLREIKRTALPDGMRVSIEMESEAVYRSERLENPRRVFFDLRNVRPVQALQDATLRFTDDVVREIRLGRHPQNTTRVVLDMEGVESYSTFTLYNPFRLVIDFKRTAPVASTTPPAPASPVTPVAPPPPAPAPMPPPIAMPGPTLDAPAVAESRPVATRPAPPKPGADLPVTPLTPPALPALNSNGSFSLARQLGLGISRIVIDAGHGGHDPGARAHGIDEAELVLDVALRLAKLIQKQPGFEVVLTRDRDVFIPLEERTAIANREGADLFLSIHANASRNKLARGVETYFLNFATNPDAEAVAARENATSSRTMNNLPDIVRAIALNNKIDESRDLAGSVQKAVVRRLSARNRNLKDLGVKQAPFVVLIGAAMPSVLAEISFVTHKQEAQLLKNVAYRQQIAEALLDGVLRYQQSLKKPRAIAATR